MEQVGAELPGQHRFTQVAVRRRQHANVHSVTAVIPHALDIAVLQYAQKFGLERQRELTYFIQKQRAVIGHFELAAAVADGAGKRPFDVAKQFAFRHAFRQRGAVEVHQRIDRARRRFVNRLRYQLLAGAGLPEDQHVQIGRSNNLNLFFELRHARREANHLRVRHLLKRRRAAGRNILTLQLFNQQRIVQRPGGQGGNQAKLLIAEGIELVRRQAVEGQRPNQILPGKQRQADTGVHLQALLAWNQPVVRVGQIAVRRETHHVTRAGDSFQTRMAFKGKAPPEHVLRQAVDGQRNKLPSFVAQQRRGVARQHVAQRGDQPLEAVLMTNTGLQFNGDFRQHVYGKAHLCLAVILTVHVVIVTLFLIVIMTTNFGLSKY